MEMKIITLRCGPVSFLRWLKVQTCIFDDFLASGTDLQNLVKTYMSYSGQVFSINVMEEDMKNLFQNEVMNCRCPGAYMSMWGIHGLSSVLGVPVQSVYPLYGDFNVRKDLHRVVQPRICRQSEMNTSQESLPTIMWTSCLGKDKPASTWVPNHFVVCARYHTLEPRVCQC